MPSNRDRYIQHEVKEITFFVIFGLTMAIIIPIFLGFATGGFQESFVSGRPLQFGDILTTYIIYYILIIVALLGLPILKIREMYITKKGEHPANQSKPQILSVAYLHDPETDGLLYSLSKELGFKKNIMGWSKSMFRLFIISTLVFGGIGIIQVFTNFSFVGIPQMPFQLTPFGEAFFSAEPPAFSETMMIIFVFSLLMGLVGYITSKFKLGKGAYFGIGIFVCLIIALLWMGYHNVAYSSSETKLFATFIFGFSGSLITLLLGSWIPFWTWHFFNNIFFFLGNSATFKEDIILISIIVWVVLFILYVSAEVLIKKKRKEYNPPIPT